MSTDATPSAEAFAEETGHVPTVVDNSAVVNAAEVPASVSSKFYTEDDLAKVRSQEKDKLYPQIESLKEEVAALKREREEKAAKKAAEAAAKQSAEEAKKREKQEAEMDVRDLLKTKEQEWESRLEQERQERERAFALLDRERTFSELQAYRQQAIEAHRDDIMPELLDLISGETIEEINSSIAGLKERSSRILESAQQAMQSARRDMTGTRVTSPQAGPLDINTGSRQFTAEEISAMSLNDYAKYRQQLLSDKARGTGHGMLG